VAGIGEPLYKSGGFRIAGTLCVKGVVRLCGYDLR
jgi:hypothetical protein